MAFRALHRRSCSALLSPHLRRAFYAQAHDFLASSPQKGQHAATALPSAAAADVSTLTSGLPYLLTPSATPAAANAPALAAFHSLGVCHVAASPASFVPSGALPHFHATQEAPLPFSMRALHSATGPGAKEDGLKSREAVSAAVPPDMSPSQPPREGLEQEEAGAEAEAGAGAEAGPRRAGSYWGLRREKLYRADGTEWPWHSFTPADTYRADTKIDLDKHFVPNNFGDTFAKYLVKSLRIPTDIFFQRRYGCRAMMLETVAAVPGMVAGMLLHLKSLRLIEHSGGWIKALLEEAENERMHLMTFMEVAQPKWYERALIFSVQAVFFTFYTAAYVVSPRVAHRIVGYLEEEAVHSYTEFLRDIDAGKIENVPAPQIAIDYWRLPKDARLRDVVEVVRADEAHHRDVNHFAANVVQEGKKLKDNPAPVEYH